MGKSYSSYFQLVGFLYGIAGIPVIHKAGIMYYIQRAYFILVMCAYLVLAITGVGAIFVPENANATGYAQYVIVHWALYPFSCALVSINMAFKNKSIFSTFTEVERISQEMANAGFRDEKYAGHFTKLALALIAVFSTFLCCIDSARESFAMMRKSPVHITIIFIRYLIYVPSVILFWAVLYHSALQYSYELDFITDIMNSLFKLMSESEQRAKEQQLREPRMRDERACEEVLPSNVVGDGSFDTLNIRRVAAVLPPELRLRCISSIRLDPSLLSVTEEPQNTGQIGTVLSPISPDGSGHNIGLVTAPTVATASHYVTSVIPPLTEDLRAILNTIPSATVDRLQGDEGLGAEEGSNNIYIYRSSWNVSLLPHRKLLDIYIQVKKLRHLSNSGLHVSLFYALFVAAWYLPILLGSLGQAEGPTFELVSMAYIIVGLVGKIAPVVFKQLVKYKEDTLLRRLSAEVGMASDAYLKKALVKFVNCIKSTYDNSPCFLLDLDASVLPILFDTTLLMISTFYNKDD